MLLSGGGGRRRGSGTRGTHCSCLPENGSPARTEVDEERGAACSARDGREERAAALFVAVEVAGEWGPGCGTERGRL